MNGFRKTHDARIVRLVSEGSDGQISVDDAGGDRYFSVQLISTARPRSSRDSASPRRQSTYSLRIPGPPFGPVESLLAGSRVVLSNTEFELLSNPRDYSVNPAYADGYEVGVLPVEMLYPYVGDLYVAGQDGALVQANIRFSLYSADENDNNVGIYQDFRAEAPVDLRSLLKVNHEIRASDTLKIVNRDVDRAGMFVDMTVRKSGANQG